jgi:hypothetical protein
LGVPERSKRTTPCAVTVRWVVRLLRSGTPKASPSVARVFEDVDYGVNSLEGRTNTKPEACPGIFTFFGLKGRDIPAQGGALFCAALGFRWWIRSGALKGRKIRRGEGATSMSQSLSQLYVHRVFSTQGRTPALHSDIREGLHDYPAGIFEETCIYRPYRA